MISATGTCTEDSFGAEPRPWDTAAAYVILNSVSQNRHGRRRTAERFLKQGNKEERQPFFKFFDRKSYLLMAIMMGGDIAFRAGGLALTLAGILFGVNYWNEKG